MAAAAAAPVACPITPELDQEARHAARMYASARAPRFYEDEWLNQYKTIVSAATGVDIDDLECISWTAWRSDFTCVAADKIGEIARNLAGTCCEFVGMSYYARTIAIPMMSTPTLVALSVRSEPVFRSSIHDAIHAELDHRRAPHDARQAYVVSDLARALADRGVVPGIQTLIFRMHTGLVAPTPTPRPLAPHAVRARLDALIAAHPELNDLKRLRQDMGDDARKKQRTGEKER